MTWLQTNSALIITILSSIVALEQVLAGSDGLKANSTFQLICNVTNFIVNFAKNIFSVPPKA